MESTKILAIVAGLLAAVASAAQNQAPKLPSAPANPPAPSLQATSDPGYVAEVASCKNPPKPFRINWPPTGPGPREYSVTSIPGVIAAGEQWKFIWQDAGNNGDGIVGTNDGGLLLAQNDKSDIVKLDRSGKPSIVYTDTHTGGAISISTQETVFVNERGLHAAIWEVAPQHKLLADTYNGETLDCIPSVLNDLVADSRGGAYFTMGGLFYASRAGVVTQYGKHLRTNGIILSRDETKLYVTNGGSRGCVRRAGGRLAHQPARLRATATESGRRRQHHRRRRPRLREHRSGRASNRYGRRAAWHNSYTTPDHQRRLRRPR